MGTDQTAQERAETRRIFYREIPDTDALRVWRTGRGGFLFDFPMSHIFFFARREEETVRALIRAFHRAFSEARPVEGRVLG